MTNKIHTIQSSDKKEFDKKVNDLLELGAELMERVAVDTAHLGKPDVIPKVEGRQMVMIIYPNT